jgi:hypothetical protein
MTLPSIVASASNLAARVAAAKIPTAATGGVGGFLKFAFDDGEWTFGRDQDEVTGDVVLVNTNTICHGWILWHAAKATKVLTTFDNDMPEAPAAIGNDQPSEARAFGAAFYDNGKPGEQLTFETNSFGGRKAVDTLVRAIIDRVTQGETVALYPLVKLTSESYRNKNYHNKLIHNPVFEIVDWCDQNGNKASAAQQLAAPERVPQPAASEGHDAESGPADEVAQAFAAPARRRRVVEA